MTVPIALSLVGVIGLVLAWTLFQWAQTSDTLADAWAMIDTIDEERAKAIRDRNRLAADPRRRLAADRRAMNLNAVSVVRAGVLAAIAEMQRTSAADHSARTVDLAAEAIAVRVDGHVNVLTLVPAVIAAVDQAIADLEMDEAALAAANALEGGPGAPIEDVLDSLRGDQAIRVLPIKRLSDLAAESRDGSFAGLVDRDAAAIDGSGQGTSPGNEIEGRRAWREEAGERRGDYRPWGSDLPKLSWRVRGIQPDEAVLEADRTWTLRRIAPTRSLPIGHPLPFEERGLSDQDMIDRGFDLDAIMAGHALADQDPPVTIPLVPFDRKAP